ncbi:MAG TPA: hypothetical protein PL009_01690, partial [Flavipsychrobacter sp.]|nr:hypothetical protein [Flavipsychrobacter sp.]
LTGMRVRTIGSATVKYNDTGACSLVTTTSETEDYVITINAGVQCAGTPTNTGNISSDDTTICNGGNVVLSLNAYPLDLGLIFQWESSPTGQSTFSPIAGATDKTFTTGALSANTDYRMAVTCNSVGGGTAYSNALTITVNNPQITNVVGATRCGVGTATLSASSTVGNTINWYADATGGAPLDTGNTFTTPILSSTDT